MEAIHADKCLLKTSMSPVLYQELDKIKDRKRNASVYVKAKILDN
jgi:hypothetical protein